MKKIYTLILFVALGQYTLTAQTGNVGVGNSTPATKLDINGDLALREGSAIAVSGANPTVTVSLSATASENSFYRFTGTPTGIMTMNRIVNGVDGQIITLVNNTTIKLRVTNNNVAGGILTPEALSQVIAANGSVTLQYSATVGSPVGRWFIINSAGSSMTDWIKATTTDEPAISTDNQYVTGNIGLGGHTGAGDNTYDFSKNNPVAPLVVVSPGNATAASTPTTTGIRLAKPGTSGSKWSVSADLKLGSYGTSGANAQSQLDIELGNGAASTPDVTVMSILGNGKVGIGTTTPARTLEVNDAMKFTNTSSDANDGVIGTAPFTAGLNIVGINTDATNRKIAMWGGITQKQNDLGNYFLNNNYFEGTGNIYIGNPSASSNPYILPRNPIGGSNATYLRLGSSSNKLQDLYSNNAYIDKVRIGSTSATNYPLEVSGTISWTGDSRTYSHPEGGTWSGWGSSTRNISIYSNGSILVTDGNRFVAASDRRIKKDIKISNSATDLTLLKKIEISDYNLKDSLFSNHIPQKKVIAQQIEEIFPQAITKSISTIPNIYTEAKSVKLSNNEAEFKMEKEYGLKVGDKVRVYNDNGELSMVEVVSCADKMNFIAKFENPKTGNYFIYGVEVDDFLSVDYDALGMLNISATQELAKQLEIAKTEIELLKKENGTLKTTKANTNDIEKLKAENIAIKSQIDELKKLILNSGLKAEK